MTSSAVSIPRHYVLWTGGWDSTFRVLDLLFRQKRVVQPVYVSDPGRRSTPIEIATMQRIARMVAEKDSDAADRLLPVRIFNRDSIKIDAKIEEAYEAARKGRHLGRQYMWLAQLAEDLDLTQLELCIHRDDRFYRLLGGQIESAIDQSGSSTSPLFDRFSFPIIDLTKLEMAERARAAGFAGILEKTWFCHDPDAKGRPCGRCNPCVYTINEGLSRRVPLPGLARYWRNRLFGFARPLVRRLRKHTA